MNSPTSVGRASGLQPASRPAPPQPDAAPVTKSAGHKSRDRQEADSPQPSLQNRNLDPLNTTLSPCRLSAPKNIRVHLCSSVAKPEPPSANLSESQPKGPNQ